MNKKIEKTDEIVCGPENFKEFREKIKNNFPDFYLVINELFKRGMITGLRGAKINMNTTQCTDVENWKSVYQDMIDSAKKNWNRLNEWEMQFITSVDNQLTSRGRLSDKQIQQLERISEKL